MEIVGDPNSAGEGLEGRLSSMVCGSAGIDSGRRPHSLAAFSRGRETCGYSIVSENVTKSCEVKEDVLSSCKRDDRPR